MVTLPVRAKNISAHKWPADGRYSVRVSYHWVDNKERTVVFDGERTHLPCDLEPNQETTCDVTIKAPSTPGQYVLEIDLVQESVAWFRDKGCETVRVPLTVVDGPPSFWPAGAGWLVDDLVGSIDHIDHLATGDILGMQGWVASRIKGAPVDSAEIHLDGVGLGSVTLGLARDDIAQGHAEFLQSGWTGRFRYPIVKHGKHLIELYACCGLECHAVGIAPQVIGVMEDGSIRMEGQYSPKSVPLPPADLITLVSGNPDVGWFLRSGAVAAWALEDALSAMARGFNHFESILDFGCGCGRVLRHLQAHTGVRFFGSDYNRALVEWCTRNLTYAEFKVNDAWPPLPYEDMSFDFIYALSVFTHMTVQQQKAWMEELSRVLRKGGLLLLSTNGKHYRRTLHAEDKMRFDAGDIVVYQPESLGTNLCTAFHSTRSLWKILPKDMTVDRFVDEGAKGNPYQDLFLLMKSDGVGGR